MVLFLYVIMLLNLNHETEPHKTNFAKIAAVVCTGSMMVLLIGALRGVSRATPKVGADIGLVKTLGRVLFTEFLLPFEISSILLLAAMVGVVMVGKLDHKTKDQSLKDETKPSIDNGQSVMEKEKLTING